ncbi:hypothetical protein LguiB_032975 [Lonicera macranthoides]
MDRKHTVEASTHERHYEQETSVEVKPNDTKHFQHAPRFQMAQCNEELISLCHQNV